MSAKSLQKAFLEAQLEESGLTKLDAKKLGFEATERGYVIPYFDLDGKKLRFSRTRLAKPHAKGKYHQPKGSAVRLYLPPNLNGSWREFAKSKKRLFITEGEKKAAKATKEGFPCIGIGGVWNFRDNENPNKPLLSELAEFELDRRTVYLVFDSDLQHNPQVRRAQNALTVELEKLGAEVLAVPLGTGKQKVGLDDFLVGAGREAFRAALRRAYDPHDALTAELHVLNQEFVIVVETHQIRSLANQELMWRTNDTSFDLENARERAGLNGKMVNAARRWRAWPNHRVVMRLIHDPTRPPGAVIEGVSLNVFRGMGVEATRGDTKPWRELLRFIARDQADWLEQWLAYPLQHPGAKLHHAVFIHSPAQGVGKTTIGLVMGAIYGLSFRLLGDQQITGRFNEWIPGTGFALVDDLSPIDPRVMRGHLKRLITAPRVPVERKYHDTYEAENRVNFLFTANIPNAIPLDAAWNRRYFVVEAPNRERPGSWISRIYTQGGVVDPMLAAAVRYRLQHQVDLAGFTPWAAAPQTRALEKARDLTVTAVQLFISELGEDPSAFGFPPARTIVTFDELEFLARRHISGTLHRQQLARAASERFVVLPRTDIGAGKRKPYYVRDTSKGGLPDLSAAAIRRNVLENPHPEFPLRVPNVLGLD